MTQKAILLAVLIGLATGTAVCGDPPPAIATNSSTPMDPRIRLISNSGPAIPLAEEIVTEASGPPIELNGCGCGVNLDYCDFPNWSFRADFLHWQRDTDDNLLLASFRQVANGIPIPFTSQDVGFDFQSGVRLTAGKAITCTSSFEVTTIIMEDWTGGSLLVAGPNLEITTGSGGFGLTSLASQATRFDSSLYSFETNYRYQTSFNPNVSFLLGTRFVHIDEQMRIVESGIAPLTAGGAVLANAERFVNTTNDLFGVQIGSDAMIPFGRSFEIGATGRAALMFNAANVEHTLAVSNGNVGPAARALEDDNVEIAGVFEAGIVANLRLRRNIIIHAGYQMLWVRGIALATDQLGPTVFGSNITEPQLIDADGSTIYHGPFIGLEIWWGSCK